MTSRGRAFREILLYGLCGGLLIALLKLTEYRFLVLEHSVEIYGALVAALFAGLGIWLGYTLTRKKPEVVVKEVRIPVSGPFVRDDRRVLELGINPRELEILGLIAEDTGLGFDRSDGIVIIQIFQQGRSNEQKVAVYAELAKRLEAECDVRPEDLIISVMSNRHADWSFGLGQAQFVDGTLHSPI